MNRRAREVSKFRSVDGIAKPASGWAENPTLENLGVNDPHSSKRQIEGRGLRNNGRHFRYSQSENLQGHWIPKTKAVLSQYFSYGLYGPSCPVKPSPRMQTGIRGLGEPSGPPQAEKLSSYRLTRMIPRTTNPPAGRPRLFRAMPRACWSTPLAGADRLPVHHPPPPILHVPGCSGVESRLSLPFHFTLLVSNLTLPPPCPPSPTPPMHPRAMPLPTHPKRVGKAPKHPKNNATDTHSEIFQLQKPASLASLPANLHQRKNRALGKPPASCPLRESTLQALAGNPQRHRVARPRGAGWSRVAARCWDLGCVLSRVGRAARCGLTCPDRSRNYWLHRWGVRAV